MKFVGFSFYCWERHQRPLLDKYYTYVINRPSIVTECTNALAETFRSHIVQKVKTYGSGLVAVIALVGIGIAVLRWIRKSE